MSFILDQTESNSDNQGDLSSFIEVRSFTLKSEKAVHQFVYFPTCILIMTCVNLPGLAINVSCVHEFIHEKLIKGNTRNP